MSKIERIRTIFRTCSSGSASDLRGIPVPVTPGFSCSSFDRLPSRPTLIRSHNLTTLFFLLFLFAATVLSAQSVYTPAGKSSIGAQFGFSSNKDSASFDVGAGVSILGRADIELEYSIIGFKEKFLGEDLSASFLSLSTSFFPIKQSGQIPLSLELSVLFGFGYYDSYALDYFNWDMYGGIFGLGVALYHKMNLSSAFALVPFVGFSYNSTAVTIEDTFGNSVEETDTASGLGVGLGFLFSLTQSSSLLLKPRLFFSDGSATFGVTLGIMGVF